MNKSPGAEEKFKEISAAYEVIFLLLRVQTFLMSVACTHVECNMYSTKLSFCYIIGSNPSSLCFIGLFFFGAWL